MSDDPWKARLEALGALLREERRAAGLSQRELAERTNVSPSSSTSRPAGCCFTLH